MPQSATVDQINCAAAPGMARPPREWELQTLALIAAIGCAALLGMLLLVSDLAIRSYLLTDGMNGLSSLVLSIIDNRAVISGLFLLLGFGYLLGFVFWRRHTTAMLASVGDSDQHAVWHWTVTTFYFALTASFLIRYANTSDPSGNDGLVAWLAWDAAQTAVRLIGLTFLLIAVWQIREQVRERVARAGIALRIQDIAPRRSAMPLPPAARTVPPAPTPGALPPADDDYWRRVAALATGQRTEIALLETTDGLARRWLLVPESGEVTKVRSGVAPGTVLTAYPQPPAATETKSFTPIAADEYHGFLEDSASGAVWYQSVKPNRVGAFLARARRARRWALYPANSPHALTAVVPSTDGRPTD
jgi:hypothetical protein